MTRVNVALNPLKCLMLLQFFGGRKTRFAHAIAVNKRTLTTLEDTFEFT